MDNTQRADLQSVIGDLQSGGLLDFVAGWYVKAARYFSDRHSGQGPQARDPESILNSAMDSRFRGNGVRVGFVSTNSITQGEQVGILWPELFRLGMKIHFAHRAFQWSNEARGMAAVHCVIIGFGPQDRSDKLIFDYDDLRGEPHAHKARNINPYLVDAVDAFLSKRTTPICTVPAIVFGSMPNDGGHLLLSNDEKTELLSREPSAEKWIRPFLGADEFINNVSRWCLWLVGIPPQELRALPEVAKRVEAVKLYREASTRATTKMLAATPSLFGEIRHPSKSYVLIPRHSSERRVYIPLGFISKEVVSGDHNMIVPDATLYHFGVLTSAMHMAWVRSVCGRLKSDYRYSAGIVYNNFPWPLDAADKQKRSIEEGSQRVLNVRTEFPGASLADLYDRLAMPPELLRAHQTLDRAVDAAYLPNGGKKTYASDAERVAFLFDLYQKLTSLLPAEKAKRANRGK